MMLVSLEQASEHLRRDLDDEDEQDLRLKIESASELVIEYIKDSANAFIVDGAVVPEKVPERVKAATLLLLGDLYKNREGTFDNYVPDAYGYGYLPRAVVALLYPLRIPTA